jgi:hypothetical protein
MEKKKYTMKDRFAFHAKRVNSAPKPVKGSKMSEAEKTAYSLGYLKHAQQSADIYNLKNNKPTSCQRKAAKADSYFARSTFEEF